jgi:two-component system, cell cycle response regulator DivK
MDPKAWKIAVEDNLVKLLLVEDTEDNRFMMRRLLEMEGYDVVEARNGEEAVRVAKEESPALVLMDLSLPVIDGLAATRLIREVPALQKTPIIAVSAHDTADFQAEALEAGCNSYITKPIDFGELDTLIKELLKAEV